jgi:hypothetical protein
MPPVYQLGRESGAGEGKRAFALQVFDPSLLDLRDYLGRTIELREALLRYRVLWAVTEAT